MAEHNHPPRRNADKIKYPFGTMKVGARFLVPDGKYRSVIAAAWFHSKSNPGKKFAVRTVDGQAYCWRVS